MNNPSEAHKIRNFSKEELRKASEGEKHINAILRKLGCPVKPHLNKILIKAMQDVGIDTSHLLQGKREDLTGKIFGHLEVLYIGPTLKCGNTTWVCREKETGIIKPVLTKHLKSGASKSFSFFFKRGEEHKQWGGFGKISGQFWSTVLRHAKIRKLEVTISIEDAWNLYLNQNRKCALSGIEIYFGESNTCPYTASLDRIDSSKGYIPGNVQWVHKRINFMKNRFSQEEFIGFCIAVAKNQKLL